MVRFDTLWKNHPGMDFPCNQHEFRNQCTIRMSVALHLSRVDLSSFRG